MSLPDASVEALLRQQGAKIRKVREARGLTIQQLADATKMHFNTIGRIERGAAEAGIEQLLKIAEVLGVRPGDFAHYHVGARPDIDIDEFVMVDELDIDLSSPAEPLAKHEVIGRFAFKKSWLQKRGVDPTKVKIVEARGDSMADRIRDGDLLLVNTEANSMDHDGIYVIDLDGHNYVRMLQRDFASGGIRIVSYNEQYKQQVLTAERALDLRIAGEVLWHSSQV